MFLSECIILSMTYTFPCSVSGEKLGAAYPTASGTLSTRSRVWFLLQREQPGFLENRLILGLRLERRQTRLEHLEVPGNKEVPHPQHDGVPKAHWSRPAKLP